MKIEHLEHNLKIERKILKLVKQLEPEFNRHYRTIWEQTQIVKILQAIESKTKGQDDLFTEREP